MTRRHLYWAVPVCLVVLFASLPLLPDLTAPVVSQDEALLLVYPERILGGSWPNRDFFMVYGPGGLWLLAAAFKLFGASVIVERLVGVVFHVLVATGVMGLLRDRTRGSATLAGVLSAVLMIPLGAGAYSWLGALGLGLLSLACLLPSGSDDSSGRPRAILAGLAGCLAGLAVLFRWEMAVVFIAALPLLIGRRSWILWCTGGALGLLPSGFHLMVAGAPTWRNVVTQRIADDTLRLPLPSNPSTAALLFAVAASLVVLSVTAVRRRTSADITRALFALLLTPIAIQRLDRGHLLYLAAAVPLVLAAAPPLRRISELLNRRYGTDASPIIGLVSGGTTLAVLLFLRLEGYSPRAVVVHDRRALPVSADEAGVLRPLLKAVDRVASPGDRLFVGTTDMRSATLPDIYLYHLFPGLRQQAYFVDLIPRAATEKGSRLVNDVDGADVLILTQTSVAHLHDLFPQARIGSSAANLAVVAHFCEVDSVARWRIYRRCAA